MKALTFALLSLLAALFGMLVGAVFRSVYFGLIATGFALRSAWCWVYGPD